MGGNATELFNQVVSHIDNLLEETLKLWVEEPPFTLVVLNMEYFRVDVTIGENTHHIHIQGKGTTKEKYHEELFEILGEELF